MCGIFGVVAGKRPGCIDRDKVAQSALLMQHRGPNAFGLWGAPNLVELAHLRLSVIDLSETANQPFLSASGRYVLIYNGEIYNYLELRRELIGLGYAFRTESDTEVLLTAFEAWGEKCVGRFNGDWALAIYDVHENSVFLSRDRFGVKPLNYAVCDGYLAFSSEIKSILHYFPETRQPNYGTIANYCRNGLGAQHVQTWFSGVYRLPPAHNLIWKNGCFTLKRYWNYPTEQFMNVTLDEAAETYRELFTSAVRLRMRSDVPVGTTLSSGIDSSSIVATLRTFYQDRHRTFTAAFDARSFERSEKAVYRGDVEINESSNVVRLAERLTLDAHFVDTHGGAEFLEDLSAVLYHLESGHSSLATVPLSRVFQLAREHVTVVLEGQGADELLGGYVLNTFAPLIVDLVRAGNFRQAWRELSAFRRVYSVSYAMKMFVRLRNSGMLERLYHFATGIDRVFGPKLRGHRRLHDYPEGLPGFADEFTETLGRSHAGGLVNLLHYGDALSMAASLESRLPFMDVDLVEFAFRLPARLKFRNGFGKYIHRYAMRGVVPDFILDSPLKLGFNTPMAMHFKPFASPANAVLLSAQCLGRGLFDADGLRAIIEAHVRGKRDHSTLLYRLLSVELWFRRFIDVSLAVHQPRRVGTGPVSFTTSAL